MCWLAPLGQQLRRIVQVAQGHHFHRRVHVAVRDADEGGGNASTINLYGVCIRARATRLGIGLEGYFGVLGRGFEHLLENGVNVWTARNRWTLEQGNFAGALDVAART